MLKLMLNAVSMTNKKVVESYMDAFHELDHEKVLSCLTDDVIWDIPGHTKLQGKEKFDAEIENDAFEGKPIIHTERLTEENNIVIAEGTVRGKIKNGDYIDLMFCDVFEMENFKIKKLTSYLVTINSK